MNRFISAPLLWMQMIYRFGRRMSVRTIRRRLLAVGYWSRRPARCPRLTLEHRRRRREWGRRHRLWDLRRWRHCIYSNESRFSIYHSDGGPGCTVGMGRGWLMPVSSLIMVMGHCMGCNPPWGGLFGRKVVYTQGNAPPHTARDTAALLDQQDVEVMDWPTRSPDMKPIEHVWDQMSVWIRDMDDPPTSTIVELNSIGLQFGQEGCGPWSRACLVMSGLFWPLR